jgi:hypothetical protein
MTIRCTRAKKLASGVSVASIAVRSTAPSECLLQIAARITGGTLCLYQLHRPLSLCTLIHVSHAISEQCSCCILITGAAAGQAPDKHRVLDHRARCTTNADCRSKSLNDATAVSTSSKLLIEGLTVACQAVVATRTNGSILRGAARWRWRRRNWLCWWWWRQRWKSGAKCAALRLSDTVHSAPGKHRLDAARVARVAAARTMGDHSTL